MGEFFPALESHPYVSPANSVARLPENDVRRKHEVQEPESPENGAKILGDRRGAVQPRSGADLVACLADGDDRDVPDEESERSEGRTAQCVHVDHHQQVPSPNLTADPAPRCRREKIVGWFGDGGKFPGEIFPTAEKTHYTGMRFIMGCRGLIPPHAHCHTSMHWENKVGRFGEGSKFPARYFPT